MNVDKAVCRVILKMQGGALPRNFKMLDGEKGMCLNVKLLAAHRIRVIRVFLFYVPARN